MLCGAALSLFLFFYVLQAVPKEENRERGGEEIKVDLKEHLFVLRIPEESLHPGGNQQEEGSFAYTRPSNVPPITEQKQKRRSGVSWKRCFVKHKESLHWKFVHFNFVFPFLSCSPQLWLLLELSCVGCLVYSRHFWCLPTSFAPWHLLPFCHHLYSGVFIDSSTGARVSVWMIILFLVSCFWINVNSFLPTIL